ncbi:efflux RND transporter permease subunit [Pseudoalteromonas sp. JBTF-M23]|uniref:Efflux RND transporter permease subunit n=1 Tax=Pseudoalteromonas caenipelagi TaxID=2726988 RepID=A0A849VHW7_9GAMM|nr:efflux RND transporter permease subunit [Pseudoalteromonas caenipelagi]NOU51267.1 efflux RND transporter permease subunit [Pseudoalteromonas caenipelagi]
MNLTTITMKNPAITAVLIAIVSLMGIFSVAKLPIQLFPDIERPQLSIHTGWRTASPKEIESEIVVPIERVLEGIPGLEEMNATANTGYANIILTFSIGTDMQKVLVDVIGRMNRLDPLPRDATQPQIQLGGGAPALTFFFLQSLPGNTKPISEYREFIEDVIRPVLTAIPGVGNVEVRSGASSEQELQITIDPYRVAQLGLSIPELTRQLGRANDVSGGQVDLGRRQYTLRMTGRYSPSNLPDQIIDWHDGQAITLGDIATIEVADSRRTNLAVQNGNPAISIRIDREPGANVLKTLTLVKAAVDELQQGVLKDNQLAMTQSFDSSVFIYRAINLLSSNLGFGVLLSIGILWLFLRQLKATLIIAVAIPLSLLATFIVLKLMGRSFNVISLAGLAFAVGMVVDASIVVLENIIRLREQGKDRFSAAVQGATQVWPALLASTATTVAIFIPVLFLEDIEGQLFGDLALTIAIAVCFSLLVAVTITPLLMNRYITGKDLSSADHLHTLWARITRGVMNLTSSRTRRVLLTVVLIGVPVSVSWLALPKIDYLPAVKRDNVDTYLQFPPATNINTLEQDVVNVMIERLQPYLNGEKEPKLKNYYIMVFPDGGGNMGILGEDQAQVAQIKKLIREEILVDLPDLVGFPNQRSLFGRLGGSRSVPLHIQLKDPQALDEIAELANDLVKEAMPKARVRVHPRQERAEPEIRITPIDQSLVEQGWNRTDLGLLVRTLGNGAYVGEHFDGKKRLDIIVKTAPWESPESLGNTPVITPAGNLLTLNQLGNVERTVGPGIVLRVDGRRTITLEVIPPQEQSLEETISILHNQVEPKIRAVLPEGGNIVYGGSADNLQQAVFTLGQNFLVAIGLLFLLMSALFRSVKDSFLVVLAMPLAMVGGIIALQGISSITYQSLDLLTMIGFVILLGLVVNNAILLVHQTRMGERSGLDRHQAVERALLLRLRPIFMSTSTSIVGMLPLLTIPGEGSEIYRGLAAVIVGGMTISAVFTLLLLPCLLRMGKGLAFTSDEIVDAELTSLSGAVKTELK